MEIKGAITILFSVDGLKISVKDRDSSITFAEIKLNQEQTCQAMSRLAQTDCRITVRGIEKVGKKMEHQEFVFEIPKGNGQKNRKKEIEEKCLQDCPDGWEPVLYFESLGSFFTKDGKQYARTTMRRWV